MIPAKTTLLGLFCCWLGPRRDAGATTAVVIAGPPFTSVAPNNVWVSSKITRDVSVGSLGGECHTESPHYARNARRLRLEYIVSLNHFFFLIDHKRDGVAARTSFPRPLVLFLSGRLRCMGQLKL